MFPGAGPGWGLLLLRMCAAGMLLRSVISYPAISISTWELVGLIVLAAALCFGVFTPLACAASCLVQAFILLHPTDRDPFHFAFSFCVSIVLLLLGPGAFSVDSRRFGRRLILPPNSE
jgi:uncharacterized membrane protein YphA (DoxX/SURF4 family)